ncbi:hypothetical protein BH23ACT2_BH23ACT2_01310 [soil metagenome]
MQFTFAQTLTEAAASAPDVVVLASIPASDFEVGGERGKTALERFKNVVTRTAAQWQPASPDESFEIVRRRLFDPITSDNAKIRDGVIRRGRRAGVAPATGAPRGAGARRRRGGEPSGVRRGARPPPTHAHEVGPGPGKGRSRPRLTRAGTTGLLVADTGAALVCRDQLSLVHPVVWKARTQLSNVWTSTEATPAGSTATSHHGQAARPTMAADEPLLPASGGRPAGRSGSSRQGRVPISYAPSVTVRSRRPQSSKARARS